MDFQSVANALDHIAETGSTLSKQALLKKYADSIEGFTDVLKFIYDPYFTTGLKQAKLNNAGIASGVHPTAEDVMSYLRINSTGQMVDAMYANAFIYSPEGDEADHWNGFEYDSCWAWAATGLVTKDLQIGVSVTTLNKVFGKGFIPKIGIMRGMLCPDDAEGIYIATEKIDGNRRLIFVHSEPTKHVSIYTRSGKQDYGLTELEADAMQLPGGYVYDCECVAIGDFADNIALRQASASILNRGSKSEKTGVKALCFDMVPIAEYNDGVSKWGAAARKYLLAATFGDYKSTVYLHDTIRAVNMPLSMAMARIGASIVAVHCSHIAPLPILGIVHDKQEAIELAKPIWETGGEGLMLNEYKAPYEVNPNPRKTLLKIKATTEYTLECVDVYEGTGKYTGMLGGIYVALWYAGRPYMVGVGSGFADYQRAMYWENPDKIVGKVVELDSFGISQNAVGGYSLNCPIFKRIRGEKE